jgi:hypothetical protein
MTIYSQYCLNPAQLFIVLSVRYFVGLRVQRVLQNSTETGTWEWKF